MKSAYVKAASSIVKEWMACAKEVGENRNMPDLYTSIIIMMYVISASVLLNMKGEDIRNVIEEEGS